MEFSPADKRRLTVPRAYVKAWKQDLASWISDHHEVLIKGKTRWMGIPLLQCPQDLWVIQEIIAKRKPGAIIEIGSLAGGLTQYMADLLTLMGGDRRVVSVDLTHDDFRATNPIIHTVTGDSNAAETRDRVAELCGRRRVMVIHDGNHQADAVYRDLVAYAPLVSRKQYFIVCDGIVDLFGNRRHRAAKAYPGPLVATVKFLEENTDFRVDLSREKFTVTYNPHGFLERVA